MLTALITTPAPYQSLSKPIIAAQRMERNHLCARAQKKAALQGAYTTEVCTEADQLVRSVTAKDVGQSDERKCGSERDLLK
jgi:hypothetical protein